MFLLLRRRRKNYREEEDENHCNRIPNFSMTPMTSTTNNRMHSVSGGTNVTNNSASSSSAVNDTSTSATFSTEKFSIKLSLLNKIKCHAETRLLKAIADRKQSSAIAHARHLLIEASASKSNRSMTNNTTYASAHKMLNNKNFNIATATSSDDDNETNDNAGQNLIPGKLSPMNCTHHAQKVSLIVIEELLKIVSESAKVRDSNGNLPSHYTVRCSVNDVDSLDLLLASHPESTGDVDCYVLTAVVIAVN